MADVAMLVVAAGMGEYEAGLTDSSWSLGGKALRAR
jgi:translation elongation factor EF-1alpha